MDGAAANGAGAPTVTGTTSAPAGAHRTAPAADSLSFVGRPRLLPHMTARKGDRSAPLSAGLPTAPAPREAKAVRNGTAPLDAPSGGLPPPTPPPATRDRRGVPRPPRPALAPRLPLVAPDPPGLSALDRLLLRTHAAHQTNAPDAPDAAELQALVAEVVGLSVERPRSAYHLGLRAARDTAAALPPAGSAAHATWYHAGRLAGWAQDARWAEIARFYTDEPGGRGAAPPRRGPGHLGWGLAAGWPARRRRAGARRRRAAPLPGYRLPGRARDAARRRRRPAAR